MVIRPKSSATVVARLPSTPDRSSTPTPASVRYSSVLSGSISLTALTSVVLPTPNPPATTIFTDEVGGEVAGRLEGTESLQQRFQGLVAERGVSRLRQPDRDQVQLPQVTQDHADHAERQVEPGRELRHRDRPLAQPDDLHPLRAVRRTQRGRRP